jgi:hypothetical protein
MNLESAWKHEVGALIFSHVDIKATIPRNLSKVSLGSEYQRYILPSSADLEVQELVEDCGVVQISVAWQ